jgi:hypothetical protein
MPDWEEHTEIIPRVVLARRRRAIVFLVLAAVALTTAAVTLLIRKREHVAPATREALTADGQKLAVILHAAFKQTHDRAEGFAGTPVLEAGIMTDAATLSDIIKTEYKLKTRGGETLELFQLRPHQVTSLLRLPVEAPPIAFTRDGHRTRLDNRDGLAVVVTADVAPYKATPELSGQLAVAARVDISSLPLAAHALEVNLVGGGPPIPLLARRGSGNPITVPVPLDAKWQVGELALHAVPVLTKYLPGWVVPVRYTALGLGLMFLSTCLVAFRGSLRK